MKKIILVALFGATFLYAENSAFDAGNLTSNSSYGLTSNEKMFKDKLDSLTNNYAQVNAKNNEANEKIEGLQSTLEGINSQYAKLNSRLNTLENSYEDIENNLTKQVQDLKAYVEESRKIQETNNKQIKKVLIELSSLVDSINANYVPKNKLDQNLSDEHKIITPINLQNIEENNATEQNNTSSKKTLETQKKDESWKKNKNSKILNLAIKNFNKDSYEDSEEKLNYLIAKKYKVAEVNFWLGEIEYKQKNYNNAIAYYKKSSALSTKESYFPKLLYHTAISLDKIGDTKSANDFYKALKSNYPNSPEAKASPNRK